MHFRTRFVNLKSCRYNLCIFKRHLPLLLRRWSYNSCVFCTRFVYFKSCRYNLFIFARDFSIFNCWRYNLCIIKTHLPLLLRRWSYNLCVFCTRFVYFKSCRYNLCISRETYPYYYEDVAIIYASSHEICLFLMVVDIIYAVVHQICQFKSCRYNLCIFARDLSI